jgi:hypothetical protein
MKQRDRGANGAHGMNWLPPWRRLAIYLRDGLACCWCGLTIEDGIKLTLDHALSRSAGGGNESANLFTSCLTCNARRQDDDLATFALRISSEIFENEIAPEEILRHISERMRDVLDGPAAKTLIKRRGGFSKALKSCA